METITDDGTNEKIFNESNWRKNAQMKTKKKKKMKRMKENEKFVTLFCVRLLRMMTSNVLRQWTLWPQQFIHSIIILNGLLLLGSLASKSHTQLDDFFFSSLYSLRFDFFFLSFLLHPTQTYYSNQGRF